MVKLAGRYPTRDDGMQLRNRTYDYYKVPRYGETTRH
jgi:hypothetical protein